MAYTMEEFVREARQQFLQELTPEERRATGHTENSRPGGIY